MSLWPLFSLEVMTPRLILRPISEADASTLATALPPDLELDPNAYLFPGAKPALGRAWQSLASYWRAYGSWTIDSWRLPFGVHVDGELVGVQTLEGDHFVRRGVVDSASYLHHAARGKGIGKEMRRAMLAFAFETLGAQEAITSAWQDNQASLGVSAALGYSPNGIERHVDGDRVGYLQHLRLPVATWRERHSAHDVQVSGFGPCAVLFGLDVPVKRQGTVPEMPDGHCQ